MAISLAEMAPSGAKMAPREAQDATWLSQDGNKFGRDGSRRSQDGTKGSQRWSIGTHAKIDLAPDRPRRGAKVEKHEKTGNCCLNIRNFWKSQKFDQKKEWKFQRTCAKTWGNDAYSLVFVIFIVGGGVVFWGFLVPNEGFERDRNNDPDLGGHRMCARNELKLKNWYRHSSFKGGTR